MKGQWLGSYAGAVGDRSINGGLMINIDEVRDHFEGIVYMKPSDRNLLSIIAYMTTVNKDLEQEVDVDIYPIDPRTGFQCTWDDIEGGKLIQEGAVYSKKAKAKLKVTKNLLDVYAVSDIGTTLKAILEKPPEEENSKILGEKKSWSEFKSEISAVSQFSYLFRGQQKPWRLCTSFHRRGRYRINQFISKDVKQLHQRLSAITSHFFDLSQPDQNGAFFNLLQHHGYPTPLLDWSYSPYVAAFFAFRDCQIKDSDEKFVRIYKFNYEEWQKINPPIYNLDPPQPHLSVMEFIAISNPRLVPQQAVTIATNIYDVEAYILEFETRMNIKYLEAFDIPATERDIAMRDLRFMGITAGSMFPGIDGVCEELRERNFEK